MTEQQPYDVVRTFPAFELRRYPSHVVAQVTVRSSFDRAGNIAFRSLFGYIAGQNRSKTSVAMTAPVVQTAATSEKIAMTAPVVQRPQADGDYAIAFILPAGMTADTAPVPTNPDVEIVTVAATFTAARTFGGRWSQSSFEQQAAELLDAVAAAGLHADGSVRFARFDPPYKPWFLRHNEVLVDVVAPDGHTLGPE
jgi:hypothetical protein